MDLDRCGIAGFRSGYSLDRAREVRRQRTAARDPADARTFRPCRRTGDAVPGVGCAGLRASTGTALPEWHAALPAGGSERRRWRHGPALPAVSDAPGRRQREVASVAG